jgi:hypothetical protein
MSTFKVGCPLLFLTRDVNYVLTTNGNWNQVLIVNRIFKNPNEILSSHRWFSGNMLRHTSRKFRICKSVTSRSLVEFHWAAKRRHQAKLKWLASRNFTDCMSSVAWRKKRTENKWIQLQASWPLIKSHLMHCSSCSMSSLHCTSVCFIQVQLQCRPTGRKVITAIRNSLLLQTTPS